MTTTDDTVTPLSVQPATSADGVPDDHPDRRDYTSTHGSNGVCWTRHTWRVDQLADQAGPGSAADLLATALADYYRPEDDPDARQDRAMVGGTRTIVDAAGQPIAELVPHAEYIAGQEARTALNDLTETGNLAGDGRYRPFVASPHHGFGKYERNLPTDGLRDVLARFFYGKPYEQMERGSEEERKLFGAAVYVALHVELDADATGQIPILIATGSPDRGTEHIWRLGKRTKANPSMFMADGYGNMGWNSAVITGTGYKMVEFWNEEEAELFAANLTTLLPGADWFVLGDDLTPEIRAAVRAAVVAARKGETVLAPVREPAEPEQPPAADEHGPLQVSSAADVTPIADSMAAAAVEETGDELPADQAEAAEQETSR